MSRKLFAEIEQRLLIIRPISLRMLIKKFENIAISIVQKSPIRKLKE